jgi:ribonuclease-3
MATTNDSLVLTRLQEKLSIRFRKPELLREALTHTSYVNEQPCTFLNDNERLEFLGDAVLGVLVADELYHRHPTAREGELTSMRAAIVRTDSLARASRRIDLGSHLFLGRGEEASGGRSRVANLCAAFEALIGAIYLDQGIEEARRLLRDLLGDAIQAIEATATRDPKSLLQERVQAEQHCTPVYRTVAETGPDHAKEFVVEVLIGDRAIGTGVGPNKQAAEQKAAQDALTNLNLDTGDPSESETDTSQGSRSLSEE